MAGRVIPLRPPIICRGSYQELKFSKWGLAKLPRLDQPTQTWPQFKKMFSVENWLWLLIYMYGSLKKHQNTASVVTVLFIVHALLSAGGWYSRAIMPTVCIGSGVPIAPSTPTLDSRRSSSLARIFRLFLLLLPACWVRYGHKQHPTRPAAVLLLLLLAVTF